MDSDFAPADSFHMVMENKNFLKMSMCFPVQI